MRVPAVLSLFVLLRLFTWLIVVYWRLWGLENADLRFQILHAVILTKLLLLISLLRMVVSSPESAWVYFLQVKFLSLLAVGLTGVQLPCLQTWPIRSNMLCVLRLISSIVLWLLAELLSLVMRIVGPIELVRPGNNEFPADGLWHCLYMYLLLFLVYWQPQCCCWRLGLHRIHLHIVSFMQRGFFCLIHFEHFVWDISLQFWHCDDFDLQRVHWLSSS